MLTLGTIVQMWGEFIFIATILPAEITLKRRVKSVSSTMYRKKHVIGKGDVTMGTAVSGLIYGGTTPIQG